MKQYIHEVVKELNSISTEEALNCAHSCPPPDRSTVVRVVKALQADSFDEAFIASAKADVAKIIEKIG